MTSVDRLPNGYRTYGADAVAALNLIVMGQKIGFALDEIRALRIIGVKTADYWCQFSSQKCDAVDRTKEGASPLQNPIAPEAYKLKNRSGQGQNTRGNASTAARSVSMGARPP